MGKNRINENLPYKNKDWLMKKIHINGLSFLQISKEVGINFKTLWYWLRKFGIIAPNQGLSFAKLKEREVIDYKKRDWLYKEYIVKRKSIKQIAKEQKKTIHIIHYWLIKNGIERRDDIEENRKRWAGKNNPNWKGGTTKLRDRIRNSKKYRRWRKSVFERDNYTCQKCKKRGGKLCVHHKKSFADILAKLTKNYFVIMRNNELWNRENGETQCIKCHKKTKNYLNFNR